MGPIILIYNLYILENAIYIIYAVGRGAKGGNLGEVIYLIDPNPL